jgi:hypothetical protein
MSENSKPATAQGEPSFSAMFAADREARRKEDRKRRNKLFLIFGLLIGIPGLAWVAWLIWFGWSMAHAFT